jgi:predicted acyltransferase
LKARRLSIDALRGLTVAFMILVNTAGDGRVSYTQLRHSVWNGCTLTDLVFPTFLFLMGVSMAFSLSPASRTAASNVGRFVRAARRSLVLILIGLVLNALPFFALGTLRYCGVMQRIGLTYLLAAVLLLVTEAPGLLILCALILGSYWALMTLVPVPGYGRTGLELGVLNPVGNLASALDRMAIPKDHLYRHGFYDPEGLLTTLPALASVLLGVLAGRMLRRQENASHLGWFAGCGAALAAVGLIWNTVFPINKRMWTSSYVMWVAGVDFLLLALFSWYLDRPGRTTVSWKRRLLAPCLAFGSNALAAYVLSEVLATVISAIRVDGGLTLQRWTFQLLPEWLGAPPLRSLEWSIAFTAICYLPIYLLYRRRILIKL